MVNLRPTHRPSQVNEPGIFFDVTITMDDGEVLTAKHISEDKAADFRSFVGDDKGRFWLTEDFEINVYRNKDIKKMKLVSILEANGEKS
jgi:hypothetical protein